MAFLEANKPSSFLPRHKTHTSWIIMEIFKNPILFPLPKMELEMLITLNKLHLEHLKLVIKSVGMLKKWRFLKESALKVLPISKPSTGVKIISLLEFWRSEVLIQTIKMSKIVKFIFMERMKNFWLDNPLLMAVFVWKMMILSSFSVLWNIVQKCKSPKIKNPFRGIFYCKNLYYYFFRENFSLFKPKYYYKNLQ